MWMVPPDIGSKVMVIFIDGDYNQGYWIGCVPEKFQNHMVPGIAAQQLPSTGLSSDQLIAYSDAYTATTNTYLLPVAEHNKKANPDSTSYASLPRPIHPFANKLAEQGLLGDRVRGVTSSSARREIPSMVFGISTPGPLDPNGPTGKIEYNGRSATRPVSRLGGSSFVMDDGDEDGQNELVRLRTRTGHQILLHNTADLIYIANAKGTAWIELTASGQIDIYAESNVNIHSAANFNLRADIDFNIEAGRNVNIKAFQKMNIDVSDSLSVLAKDTYITSNSQLFVNATGNINIKSASNLAMGAAGSLNLKAFATNITAGSTLGLLGQTGVNITSPKISQNDSGKKAIEATSAEVTKATKLTIVQAPRTGGGSVNTILQRVPMHEPWSQHENNDPGRYTPETMDTTDPVNPNYYPAARPPNSVAPTTVSAEDALVFTSGTGDAAHFAQATTELQNAVKACAIAFKERTGRPMVLTSSFRSTSEQQALYDRWVAAGGGPSTPKAGGIFTPVNPKSSSWPNSHNRGIAFDSPNCAELDRMGILDANGLYRPVPATDPVHAVLKKQPLVPGRPSSNQPPVNNE
jgi:uncharacterized protein (DUF2345 family)